MRVIPLPAWVVVIACWLAVGCAPSPTLGAACDGSPRAIEDCSGGPAWADCGGTGSEPRFACRDFDCRWFANDCVASGFRASACPSSDLCCVVGSGSRSPFAGDPSTDVLYGVPGFTLGWGTEPWDRTRDAVLELVIAPTSSAARPAIDCSEGSELLSSSVCQHAADPLQSFVRRTGDVAIASLSVPGLGGFAGHAIVAELFFDAPLRARVCAVPYADGLPYGCDTMPAARGCAVEGAVTVDTLSLDDGGRIDLHAVFEDGSVVDMRF